MQWLIQYAFSLVSKTPRYQWGGENPIIGFDCSGFVLELLKAAGEMPFNQTKMSAQELYNHYSKVARVAYAAGSLSFYGHSADSISHVGFCLDSYLMLEAAGGDSRTVDIQHAIDQNAFVKMRPIKYRKDLFCVLKPNYSAIGMI